MEAHGRQRRQYVNVTGSMKLCNTKLCVVDHYFCCTIPPATMGGRNASRILIIVLVCIIIVIESVDSISRDEPDSPLTQYITNAGISHARYTITHFKHHHRVLRLISNRMRV